MCAHVCKGMFSRTSDVRIERVVEKCLWCVDALGIRGARWAKLPGDLSWVKAGEWLSHTHSVEHVGDWGKCVKCCLCVLKHFLNTYILLTWKKNNILAPPTCCTWNNGKLIQLNTYGLVASEIMVGTKVRQGQAADCFLKQCSEGYCLGYATYLRLVRPPCPWLSTSTIQLHCKLHQMYTCTYASSWSF